MTREHSIMLGYERAARAAGEQELNDRIHGGGDDEPRKISTNFWAKPIGTSAFDWSAHFDGDEPDDNGQMLVGYGSTEQDAINDLREQADERP